MDAFLLDIGQVLPYMGIQATAAAMTPEEAAWVCPTALRLVRFARSQNWLAVASLIMAVASAGRSLPRVALLTADTLPAVQMSLRPQPLQP